MGEKIFVYLSRATSGRANFGFRIAGSPATIFKIIQAAAISPRNGTL